MEYPVIIENGEEEIGFVVTCPNRKRKRMCWKSIKDAISLLPDRNRGLEMHRGIVEGMFAREREQFVYMS